MRKLLFSAVCASFCLAMSSAIAAEYPNGTVRVIYPSTAGSSGDVRVRKLAEILSGKLGARFVVENKPGAAGAIGSAYVAKAAPDGYTLLAAFSNFVTTPVLVKNPGYDPLRDFVPVASLVVASPVLVVNPALPVRTVQELIALARAKPGTISLANGGLGGANHLPAVLFERAAGIQLLHIPYKGEGQALPDVLGGQVSGMFMYMLTAFPQIRAGKLRPLAVAMRKRNPALPEVPTMEEAGIAGSEFRTWLGVLAPAGTPRSVVESLNREMSAAMHLPEIEAEAAAIGTEVYTQSAEEFGVVIKQDVDRYGKVIKELNISLE